MIKYSLTKFGRAGREKIFGPLSWPIDRAQRGLFAMILSQTFSGLARLNLVNKCKSHKVWGAICAKIPIASDKTQLLVPQYQSLGRKLNF